MYPIYFPRTPVYFSYSFISLGYLETILEEDDEEYEEEEGCSGRHWWTADSDTDTDSVIRVDNHGQAQQQQKPTSCQQTSTPGHVHGSSNNSSAATISGEKDEVRPHFRSSASSKPFELEDLHLFDQLDHAFEETLREPMRLGSSAFGHQSQSVASDNRSVGEIETTTPLKSNGKGSINSVACAATGRTLNGGTQCQNTTSTTGCSATGVCNNNESKAGTGRHHVFIESTNNGSKDEMTTKGLKMLTQENVKAHSEENSTKNIYEVGEEKEQSSKKLGNAESRETFGSSLSPSSSDSEAPAEVAEEDFFYSSPGSEEEECRSQEETESEESCSSSDDSEKKGVVLAEFSLGTHTGNTSGGFNPPSGGIFGGGTRTRRSFDSPSRLKSFRSFDSLNCLAGTELLFSKPDTFPSINHIKEVSEPSSESESSNDVSQADDRGMVIPEEDEEEEEEENNKIEGSQSLPSQHLNTSVAAVGFPGPGLNQIRNKNSTASSSTSTVSSNASGSGLRSTENLSEDSGIGNDGVSSTAASTPGAFIEESNLIMPNSVKQNEDGNKATATASTSSSSSISPSVLSGSPTKLQEVDTALVPDSAKEYITHAEFALNPFVYSSLSSSEPESSISSAPSLTCNKMSIGKEESLQFLKNKDISKEDVHCTPDQDTNITIPNAIKNTPHEFVSDCHVSDKADVQPQNVSCHNESEMEKEADELLELAYSLGESVEESQHDPNFNDTSLLMNSTDCSNSIHSKYQKPIPPPPSSSPVQAIMSLQSTTVSQSSKSLADYLHHQTTTSNGKQNKGELANSNNNPSHEGQPVISDSRSVSSASQLPATSIVSDVNQACARNVSAEDKLANTSLSKLSAQLPATANHAASNGNGTHLEVESISVTTNMSNVVVDSDITVDIPVTRQRKYNNNMTSTKMDGKAVDQENVIFNEENDDGDITSSSSSSQTTTESSCMASPHNLHRQPQQQTITTIINEHERNGKEVSSLSSSLSSQTCSPIMDSQEGEEGVKQNEDKNKAEDAEELNIVTRVQNPSSSYAKGLLAEGALNMSNVDDAEEEAEDDDYDTRKQASLQLSSAPLSNASDKSFPTCPLPTQDHHHQSQKHSSSSSYSSSSSSSSGDEQNETSQQPRFRRQRSDSESEYEAAESAVERNNVDMAYDIIVNSPSKKQGLAAVASPISSVSDVVGATTEMMPSTVTPTITQTTTSPGISATSCSSLAHVQPVVQAEEVSSSGANTSALTPAQYHSQSQNETSGNKCDNKKSGPVSTLNGSLINIHRNNMHNSNTTAVPLCKDENIKYNMTTTTSPTMSSAVNPMRNYDDKKLPVFESCLDDYDDDDDYVGDNNTIASVSTTASNVHAAPPSMPILSENMQGSSSNNSNSVANSTTPQHHTSNNIFIAVSSYTHKVCTTSHEDGQMKNATHTAAIAVNGIQQSTNSSLTKEQASASPSSSSSSSHPLEKQQPHRHHEIENTSLLLHHPQLHHNQLHKQQRQHNNQREEYENSDEFTRPTTQVALPQSHFHVSASSSGLGARNTTNGKHKGLIVTDDVGERLCDGGTGSRNKNKNFSGHVEAEQHQQQHNHQQHPNVLRSVTLDDSTSADVAHNNNLQFNHEQSHVLSSASYPAGVALKSNSAPRPNENHSIASSSSSSPSASSLHQRNIPESPYQIPNNNHHSDHKGGNANNNHFQSSTLDNSIEPTTDKQQRAAELTSSNNISKGYHHHPNSGSNNKVVISEPYYPNQIGVAEEVKKFLAGYVASQECVSFSGPVEPPSSSSYLVAAEKESTSTFKENKHSRKTEPEYYHSQSVENLEKSGAIGPTASANTPSQVNTTGRERVILGDSNFGFFGCSTHSRSSATNTTTSLRGEEAYKSHESVLSAYSINSNAPTLSTTSNVLPQVNLDLHSISAAATNESGFSGYGFPCSSIPTNTNTSKEGTCSQQHPQPNTWLHDKEQQQLRIPLKENNNTFCPSSVDTSLQQACSSGSSSTTIKRSVSPFSPFSSISNKAAHELPKDLGKAATPPPPPLRRDQPQQQSIKDIKQQKHLHQEDNSLYAGLDKFSVPLGAITAAVVAVAPTFPSYIVGSSNGNVPSSSASVEKYASKTQQNSNGSLEQAGSNTGAQHQSALEAKENLSKVFPKGTVTQSCTQKSSATGNTSTLPKGGENSNTHGAAIVPDILKQFPCKTSSANAANTTSETTDERDEEAVEHIRRSGVTFIKGVMEFDITATNNVPCTTNRNDGSSNEMSGNGRNINKSNIKKQQDSSSHHSVNTSSNIDSISSVEMLRSNSPAGSSAAPSGIPLKTKTYGARNEVEVVVVSSRTPSPAPGGFVSTSSLSSQSSSSSSQKLPSSSPTSGQERNEPAFSSSSQQHHHHDQFGVTDYCHDSTASSTSSTGGGGGVLRESSIPPPPSSPSPVPTGTTASGKATRSRVHFSPVVSEISWRESYIDQSSECSGSSEDLLAKLDILDSDGNPVMSSHHRGGGGRSAIVDSNNHSASANLRKAGAAAAATKVVGGGSSGFVGRSGDIHDNCGGNNSDVGNSVVRPLQVYDIQMSARADSPSSLIPTRGQIPSGKCPILVEKVEMRSSPLHDHEDDDDREDQEQRRRFDRLLALGESQSSRKLMLLDDNDEDEVDNDPEKITDLVDFRHNSNDRGNNGIPLCVGSNNQADQNNGTLGLYEDVEVQIDPESKKMHGSTTLSMVPDLLSQCENTNNTLTHIDVKIEETIPGINTKNIVLNIGPASSAANMERDIHQQRQQQPQKNMRKSQSPQPQDVVVSSSTTSPEPRQIFPKMFAEDNNKNDNKRNLSSSSLSSSSKGKKSSKGFIIQGLGSSGKKSDKDVTRDNGANNGNSGNVVATSAVTTSNASEQAGVGAEAAKENKKASKPGFFERLSKIRLSSGSKNKKQKVHPKTDEIHQEGDSSGTPTVTSTIGGAASRPLRSANSVNVNGTGNTNKHGNNSGANNNSSSSQIANYNSSSGSSTAPVQPILKKSGPASTSTTTIPSGVGPHYGNSNEMGMVGDSENEPDDATQAFENILEEIAGLKSIQLRQEKSSSSSIDKSPSSQQVRSFAKRKQFYNSTHPSNAAGAGSPSPPVSPHNNSDSRSYSDLDTKLSQFKEDASRTLDTISKSHPDLEIIEDAVRQRQKSLSPEPSKLDIESTSRRPGISTLPKPASKSPSYVATEAAQNSEREWYRLLKSATEKFSYQKGPRNEHSDNDRENINSHKTGIVETDLDTGKK